MVRQLLSNYRNRFSHDFARVDYYYSEANSVKERIKNVNYIQGIPEDNFSNDSGGHLLLVIDDQQEKVNDTISKIFLKGSHHDNISVILILQVSCFSLVLKNFWKSKNLFLFLEFVRSIKTSQKYNFKHKIYNPV